MDTTFLDECFKARMNTLRGRFPLDDFRKKFREEYARRGIVMIQDKVVNVDLAGGMTLDSDHGFIFSSQRNLDIALWLLRRWGFNVMLRREHDERQVYSAYVVQLPDEYLRRQMGSDRAGIISTGLRSVRDVDRTKRKESSEHEYHDLIDFE